MQLQQQMVGEERTAPCSVPFEGKASENAEVVIKILYGEVLKTPQPYYAQFQWHACPEANLDLPAAAGLKLVNKTVMTPEFNVPLWWWKPDKTLSFRWQNERSPPLNKWLSPQINDLEETSRKWLIHFLLISPLSMAPCCLHVFTPSHTHTR